MKKNILIASFFATIMLMASFASVGSADLENDEQVPVDPDDDPGDPQTEDVGDLISSGVEDYGWLDDLIEHVTGIRTNITNVIADFETLEYDITLPLLILDDIDRVRADIDYITDLVFKPKAMGRGWIKHMSTAINDLVNDIDTLLDHLYDLKRLYIDGEILDDINATINDINATINGIIDFAEWFNSDPWMENIIVHGSVFTYNLADVDGEPVVGAKTACRGESTLTESDGSYWFEAPPIIGEVAEGDEYLYLLPHESYITVEYDGITYSTIKPLLVCSGGCIFGNFKFYVKGNDVSAVADAGMLLKINLPNAELSTTVYEMIPKSLGEEGYSMTAHADGTLSLEQNGVLVGEGFTSTQEVITFLTTDVGSGDGDGDNSGGSSGSGGESSSNNAPHMITSVSDKTVEEGGHLEFAIMASDSDGDSLTFSARYGGMSTASQQQGSTNYCSFASSGQQNSDQQQVTYYKSTYIYDANNYPSNPFTEKITVSDGNGGSDSIYFVITVDESNSNPLIYSSLSDDSDRTEEEPADETIDVTVQFDGSGSYLLNNEESGSEDGLNNNEIVDEANNDGVATGISDKEQNDDDSVYSTEDEDDSQLNNNDEDQRIEDDKILFSPLSLQEMETTSVKNTDQKTGPIQKIIDVLRQMISLPFINSLLETTDTSRVNRPAEGTKEITKNDKSDIGENGNEENTGIINTVEDTDTPFSSISTFDDVTYIWDCGDGQIEIGLHPKHIYQVQVPYSSETQDNTENIPDQISGFIPVGISDEPGVINDPINCPDDDNEITSDAGTDNPTFITAPMTVTYNVKLYIVQDHEGLLNDIKDLNSDALRQILQTMIVIDTDTTQVSIELSGGNQLLDGGSGENNVEDNIVGKIPDLKHELLMQAF